MIPASPSTSGQSPDTIRRMLDPHRTQDHSALDMFGYGGPTSGRHACTVRLSFTTDVYEGAQQPRWWQRISSGRYPVIYLT
jgi:hypothetical protein